MLDTLQNQSTPQQRQSLYKFGLKRNYVHEHIKTKAEADILLKAQIEAAKKIVLLRKLQEQKEQTLCNV